MTGESTAESESDEERVDRRGGVIEPYRDEEILDVFAARDDIAEPMTAPQIAARNGRSAKATLKHCKRLADEGALRTKKTGARGRVFWIPLDAGLFEEGRD